MKYELISALIFIQSGGPSWVVPLGRRDSINASLSGSNSNIPASNDSFKAILRKFNRHGLDVTDLVALSGKLPLHATPSKKP